MCLLIHAPSGVTPDITNLSTGAENNDDGHGFAIVSDGKIIVGRGMDSDRVIDRFMDTRAKHPDGPALFHSRIATGGNIDKENCHPFVVGGDKRTVLAHNGIMPRSVQPGKHEVRSDTRIVAERTIPGGAFGKLWRPESRQRFEAWLGTYNKVLLLTVDPRFDGNAFLLNEQAGYWEDDGAWYSNTSYLPYVVGTYVGTTFSTKGGAWFEAGKEGYRSLLDTECPNCLTNNSVDPVTGHCSFCKLCADCSDLAEDCMCYTPAGLDREMTRDMHERMADDTAAETDVDFKKIVRALNADKKLRDVGAARVVGKDFTNNTSNTE